MNTVQQNLYSRQIGAIGKDAMKSISNLKVFIIGLDTAGIEIAKCLCLLGIKKLYINDERRLMSKNKGRNYSLYGVSTTINKNPVDKNTLDFLKNLNNYVEVETTNIKISIIKDVDILIQTRFTKIMTFTPIQINKICRKYKVKHIVCSVIGLSGYIFSDFGELHIVRDPDGEKYKSCYIKSITNGHDGYCYLTLDNSGNGETFEKGDKFKIENHSEENIFDILELSDNIIKVKGNIDEKLTKNLCIFQVKNSMKIKHNSLEEICSSVSEFPNVTINITDYDKTISLVDDFHLLCKTPNILGKEDTNFKALMNTRTEFPTIGSIIGSIIAGEIIKIAGKYTPLNQECIIDYSELYYEKLTYKSGRNSIHNDIYSLLTKNTLKKLKTMNVFVVGCGALGCEYLKLLAMLNISSSKGKGKIVVTDMDHIELSNLNRQFLFNNDDIGNSKSKVAANKIKILYPNTNIEALNYKVGIDTENIFDRKFWERQDIIINALDNVEARQYVDNQCVIYSKPLFESGTLGTKCNGQIIIPHLTKSYSETRDPVENSIPVCTVKNFPFKIEHCIEWSLELFNLYFHDFIKDVEALSKGIQSFECHMRTVDNENLVYEKLKTLEMFKSCLKNPGSNNIADFAKRIFQKIYINSIKQILHTFPIHKKDDNGDLFWKGNKLPPKIIDFTHSPFLNNFIDNFSVILSRCLGLEYKKQTEIEYEFSEFKPDDNYKFKIKDDDKITEGSSSLNLEAEILNLTKILTGIDIHPDFKFNGETFEKDDDNNNHVEFVNVSSNIRALIYNIKPIDYLECKLISGRIVPALSTTTTLVTALMMMEILKYVTNMSENKKIAYSDIFVNTGINLYLQSEPQNCIKTISGQIDKKYGCKIKAIPECFTIWDKIKLTGKMGIISVKDLIEYLFDKYNIDIDMLCYKTSILYSKYNNSQQNYKFIDLYNRYQISKNEYMIFEISSISKEMLPVICPKLVYSLYI